MTENFLKSPGLFSVFLRIFFYSEICREQSSLFSSFSFSIDIHSVWSSGWVCSSKFQKHFLSQIPQDGIWLAHLPFIHMVKSKFLAHFWMNNFPHPIVSSFGLILLHLIYFCFIIKVSKIGGCCRGRPEGSPSNSYRGVREGATLFPVLLHFTLDTYIIMLGVKQGGIKYNVLKRLWYDTIWDWALVSRTIGKHSTY